MRNFNENMLNVFLQTYSQRYKAPVEQLRKVYNILFITVPHTTTLASFHQLNIFICTSSIDDHWAKGSGPIFFYTGNEGDIVGFWQNSGLLFDLAPQFRALVVFGEHVSRTD